MRAESLRFSRRTDSVVSFEQAPPSFAVQTNAGVRWTAGDGPATFVIRVPDKAGWDRLQRSGTYEAAVAFVRGDFDIEGDVVAALRWWYARPGITASFVLAALRHLHLESWLQSRGRARRNIEFHYDRSNEFYEQFLDRRLLYSCAYFTAPSVSLDEAQAAKLDLICRKLDLGPRVQFLDIGCGWGGLVLHAAERFGAIAIGCTLSARQFAYAREQAKTRGLQARVTILNADYRELAGRFDRIASVGMYEHVGRRRLQDYFERLSRLLNDDGLVLNHGIARPDTVSDDDMTLFLRRHVFPGGELPYYADVVRAAERAGFEVIDVENLRPHYALTCAAWVRRLQAHRDACLTFVDLATYRTWLLYLAGSAASFERGDTELYQTLLAKRRPGAPRRLTREQLLLERADPGSSAS
ncbi:MAG TPA: cyclopropane-fatty-acyl-phospholipid synthase family protein [Vicinamibacterales bacterium]|nr:cyclopropane-fatty-acyl-phospholipid synthase family protein [Vicinamibacterales bacterium]